MSASITKPIISPDDFSVPSGTNIVEWLKRVQLWAIEQDRDDIQGKAKRVKEAYAAVVKSAADANALAAKYDQEIDASGEARSTVSLENFRWNGANQDRKPEDCWHCHGTGICENCSYCHQFNQGLEVQTCAYCPKGKAFAAFLRGSR